MPISVTSCPSAMCAFWGYNPRRIAMSLKEVGVIDIPDSTGTLFDHGAFEPRSRRVFVAHTARDRIEVIDHDTSRHLTTLHGFPEAAGVVADDGQVLITNRGAAGLAWIDAIRWKPAPCLIPACGRTESQSFRA